VTAWLMEASMRRLPIRQPLGGPALQRRRILTRAWLYVIWYCWQDGVAYDPAKHKALQRILAEKPAAA